MVCERLQFVVITLKAAHTLLWQYFSRDKSTTNLQENGSITTILRPISQSECLQKVITDNMAHPVFQNDRPDVIIIFKILSWGFLTLVQTLRGQESLSLAQSLGRFRRLLARSLACAVGLWSGGRSRAAIACRSHKKGQGERENTVFWSKDYVVFGRSNWNQ